jgi:hypothetical protein
MLEQHRASRAIWFLPLLLVAGYTTASCDDGCDEEAECSEAPFEGCFYGGCGELSCTLALTVGHVVCNDDGTQGCSAWPQVAEGCETVGTPEDQAGCTQLLLAVLSEVSSANAAACRLAVLDIAPCALEDGATCDFAPVDAACFDDPPACD